MNMAEQYVRVWDQLPGGANWRFKRIGELGVAITGSPKTVWTEHELQLIREIIYELRPENRQCYANAQRIIMVFDDPRVTYHEGYVAPSDLGGLALDHAWVTINGKVWETCPHVRDVGGDYFGIAVPNELVCACAIKTRVHTSLLCDHENDFEYARKILGDPPTTDRWMPRKLTK